MNVICEDLFYELHECHFAVTHIRKRNSILYSLNLVFFMF